MLLDSRKWLKHSSKWGTQTQPRESERQLRSNALAMKYLSVDMPLSGRQGPLLLHTWAVNPPGRYLGITETSVLWLDPYRYIQILIQIEAQSFCMCHRYVILWSKVANSAASALFIPFPTHGMSKLVRYAGYAHTDKISNTHRAILHRHDWTRLRVPHSTTFSASFFELPLTLKRHSPTFSCTLVLSFNTKKCWKSSGHWNALKILTCLLCTLRALRCRCHKAEGSEGFSVWWSNADHSLGGRMISHGPWQRFQDASTITSSDIERLEGAKWAKWASNGSKWRMLK